MTSNNPSQPWEPIIKMKDKFWVIGMKYEGSMQSQEMIQKLWIVFNQRAAEVKNRINTDDWYGVFYSSPEQLHSGNMTYLAAVEVSENSSVPEGMMAKQVEGGTYAVVTHHGPLSKIAETIDFIFRTWIPRLEYKLDNRPSFELYDQRFKPEDPESPDSEFDIYAAIGK